MTSSYIISSHSPRDGGRRSRRTKRSKPRCKRPSNCSTTVCSHGRMDCLNERLLFLSSAVTGAKPPTSKRRALNFAIHQNFTPRGIAERIQAARNLATAVTRSAKLRRHTHSTSKSRRSSQRFDLQQVASYTTILSCPGVLYTAVTVVAQQGKMQPSTSYSSQLIARDNVPLSTMSYFIEGASTVRGAIKNMTLRPWYLDFVCEQPKSRCVAAPSTLVRGEGYSGSCHLLHRIRG